MFLIENDYHCYILTQTRIICIHGVASNMKIENFLEKIKHFFKSFDNFLENKKNKAQDSGNQGRTGKIRESTLKMLVTGIKTLSKFISDWNLERASLILGQYRSVKDAVAQIREEDEMALNLLRKVENIYEESPYPIPENIRNAIAAHIEMNQLSITLAENLRLLTDLESEVEYLSRYPVIEADPIFTNEQLEARQKLVMQYEDSITQMEARFKQRTSETNSSTAIKSSGPKVEDGSASNHKRV